MDELDKKDLETIDIETPIDEATPPTPVPVVPNIPNQKKSKKGLIIGVFSVVVLLALVGFGYYWFFVKDQEATVTKTGDDTVSQTATPADDTRDYAKELIEKIRLSEDSLKEDYPNSKVENGEPAAPAYMYGNNLYYVSGQFGHTLLVTDIGEFNEAFNSAGEKAAVNVLEKEELIKKQKEYTTTFINDNVICTVSQQGYPVFISCANTRDYKTPSETVQPFAKAYFANPNAADESQIIFGQPKITDKSDGYKNAVVGIGGYSGTGGFAGLFYGKDNTWTYWTGSQSVIPCSNYNTYELQKSFEGDACYVDGQEENSVVIVTLTK